MPSVSVMIMAAELYSTATVSFFNFSIELFFDLKERYTKIKINTVVITINIRPFIVCIEESAALFMAIASIILSERTNP